MTSIPQHKFRFKGLGLRFFTRICNRCKQKLHTRFSHFIKGLAHGAQGREQDVPGYRRIVVKSDYGKVIWDGKSGFLCGSQDAVGGFVGSREAGIRSFALCKEPLHLLIGKLLVTVGIKDRVGPERYFVIVHGGNEAVEPFQGYIVVHIVGDMQDIAVSLFDQMLSGCVGAVKIVQQDFIYFTVGGTAFNQDTVDGLSGDIPKKGLILTVAAVCNDAVRAPLGK